MESLLTFSRPCNCIKQRAIQFGQARPKSDSELRISVSAAVFIFLELAFRRGAIVIDGDRLWAHLGELGEIGRNKSTGGITRLSFTDEEWAAKDLVASYMQEANLSVREDAVGNLIGRKEGKDTDAPVVLVGSHLDSVYEGGMFDGALGVLAGVEILRTMEQQGLENKHPIEVIAFTDEEGARFSFGYIGSRGIAGILQADDLRHTDDAGVSIAESMEACGYNPYSIDEAARAEGSIKAYVELHIEQGKVLEAENLPIGIVEGIASNLWRRFTVEGEAGHAGTTPMGLRRDALAATAPLLQNIEKCARSTGTTVGTVGQLEVFPGGINVIPDRVRFIMDLRDLSEQVRDEVERHILNSSQDLCQERDVRLSTELLQSVEAVPCSDIIREASEEACKTMNIETFSLPSGAGHDAIHLKDLCSIGLIFVRSEGGISHNHQEWSTKEDCARGADVLYYTVLDLAGQA